MGGRAELSPGMWSYPRMEFGPDVDRAGGWAVSVQDGWTAGKVVFCVGDRAAADALAKLLDCSLLAVRYNGITVFDRGDSAGK